LMRGTERVGGGKGEIKSLNKSIIMMTGSLGIGGGCNEEGKKQNSLENPEGGNALEE